MPDLTYPCQKAIFEYLSFSKRRSFAKKCESVRQMHRTLPFHMKNFQIEYSSIQIDNDFSFYWEEYGRKSQTIINKILRFYFARKGTSTKTLHCVYYKLDLCRIPPIRCSRMEIRIYDSEKHKLKILEHYSGVQMDHFTCKSFESSREILEKLGKMKAKHLTILFETEIIEDVFDVQFTQEFELIEHHLSSNPCRFLQHLKAFIQVARPRDTIYIYEFTSQVDINLKSYFMNVKEDLEMTLMYYHHVPALFKILADGSEIVVSVYRTNLLQPTYKILVYYPTEVEKKNLRKYGELSIKLRVQHLLSRWLWTTTPPLLHLLTIASKIQYFKKCFQTYTNPSYYVYSLNFVFFLFTMLFFPTLTLMFDCFWCIVSFLVSNLILHWLFVKFIIRDLKFKPEGKVSVFDLSSLF